MTKPLTNVRRRTDRYLSLLHNRHDLLMERTDHIHVKRLMELSRMRTIVEEPEWKHMKDCQECISEFVVIVREQQSEAHDSQDSTSRPVRKVVE